MKRVLLTGATGFVGKRVLRELLSRGADVSIVLRPGKSTPDGVAAAHVTEDLFSERAEFWTAACDGIDTLVHAAWYAEPGKYAASPKNLTCMTGTVRMAEVAASIGVKRFVGIGSCFEYDLGAGYLKISTPLVPRNPYGAAKAGTYLALSRVMPLLGVSFAWCRLFYLYGEGEDPRRLVPYLRHCLAAGEPAELTSGQQIRDYLDVTEAGRRIAAITLSSAEGAFNISSGVPLTIEQMALRIANEYGRTDLLRFGARPDNPEDPACVIGEPTPIAGNDEMESMSDRLRELYRQHDLPIFQNRMYVSPMAARNCPKGDIRLVEDMETGLVFNSAFDASVMNYDSAYQNEQGISALFRTHLEAVADLIEAHMGRSGLVEVGCGKGTFLELLLRRGVEVTGFDPTYEGSNPLVRKEYFLEELGLQGEGLILRHVLEHIKNPVTFLETLAAANGGRGLIYIEVPCFDWICDKRAWFDIFYEHVNYFRLSDFHRIFGKIIHADRAFGGQYLRIIGDLATIRLPVRDPADAPTFPPDFTARLDAETQQGAGGATVVWGGASKGVIFSLLRERVGRPVDRVIDINPEKQGRYLPASGLRVMGPAEGLDGLPQGSTIHVMNPNYLQEIRVLAGPGFNYRVMSND